MPPIQEMHIVRQKLRWLVGISILALLLAVGCSGGTDGGTEEWTFGPGDDADSDPPSRECVVDSDCPGDEVCSALEACLVNCTETPAACRRSEFCVEIPSGKKGCAPDLDHGADDEEDDREDDEDEDDDASDDCAADADCSGDQVCSSDGACVVNCTEDHAACKDSEVCTEVPSGKNGCIPDGF